jgi:predicted nuclease of predicted toxin-antitoxin system
MEEHKILDRMVVTMDKDFGELVYNSKLSHGGVLLLRLEEANSNRKVEIARDIIKNFPDKILTKFCVYKDGKLRIRG